MRIEIFVQNFSGSFAEIATLASRRRRISQIFLRAKDSFTEHREIANEESSPLRKYSVSVEVESTRISFE